ncbi:MAG: TerB family tellurite resistance protein [Magnetococcales bacterium]|nr:TerB family tellurite resistance protein [Magnetococcales bacterium]
MSTQNEWKERGQRAVGAATDLATGLFRGLQNIGPRIQAAQYKPIVEAFCAWSGLMAAQHGRLQRTELDGFRNFLMQNREHPIFGGFPLEELIDKFRNYAIKAFLEETDIFYTVLNPIPQDSEEARLIITGCLNVIYADGHCDENERMQLEQLANRLGVNTEVMARKMGVILPAPTRQSASPYLSPFARSATAMPSPPPAAPEPPPYSAPQQSYAPPPPAPAPQQQPYAPPPPPPQAAPPPPPAPAARPAGGSICTLCQGKGCVFCNQTGYKG